MDTADYLLDERLRKRLEKEPNADLAPYRELYLKHLWACARFYTPGAARSLAARSPT